MGIGLKPVQFTITPAVASTNDLVNFLENVDNIFTVNSYTSDGLAHIIVITNENSSDYSSRTLTVVGLDYAGQNQTETLNGPTTLGTVNTTLYYSYISTITISGGDVGNLTFSVGIDTGAISRAYQIDWSANSLEINTNTSIADFTVQYSRSPDLPNSNLSNYVSNSDWIWIDWSSSETGVYHTLYCPVNIRFIFNTYTADQPFIFCYSQSRNN